LSDGRIINAKLKQTKKGRLVKLKTAEKTIKVNPKEIVRIFYPPSDLRTIKLYLKSGEIIEGYFLKKYADQTFISLSKNLAENAFEAVKTSRIKRMDIEKPALAIIRLKGGTSIEGHIMFETADMITVKNQYSEFSVKRSDILELNFEGIIDIRQAERTKLQSLGYWIESTFSLQAAYLPIVGAYRNLLKAGLAGLFSYDQGLETLGFIRRLLGNKRRLWFPGFRVELGYVYVENRPSIISGFTGTAGPLWRVELAHGRWGDLLVAGLAGLSILRIKGTSLSESTETFTANALMGYQYRFGAFSFFINGRLGYYFDKRESLIGVGGSVGFGYSI